MGGLWGLLDSAATAVLNFRRPWAKELAAQSPDADQSFIVGKARAFGSDAPQEGETVSIPFGVFTKHAAAIGGSGCGKSTITHRLRDAFVRAGINCIDIDYRGDGTDRALVRSFAAGIPPERVTLIDLRDRDRVVPLNFLGFGAGDSQNRAAIVYSALKDQAPSWGVRLGADLRASLIALAESQGSLLDLASLLAPEGTRMRQALLSRTSDGYVVEFLTTFEALKPEEQRSRAAAVTNKLDDYLHHPVLRTSLGLPGAPNIRQIMDEAGHLTLVGLGADRNSHAGLVGRMLVSAIQRAAMARVDIPESKRTDCRLIVDESQNILGEESCQILAEGRRFRLGLVLCSQFAGQLPAELRASVKVNCATQFYFHTSASEASDISSEIVSSLTREEIRKTMLAAPVGAAVVVRRGEPAAFVTTLDSPDPHVDADSLAEFKRQIKSRTTIPWADAQRIVASRGSAGQKIEEEVSFYDVRKPFRKRQA